MPIPIKGGKLLRVSGKIVSNDACCCTTAVWVAVWKKEIDCKNRTVSTGTCTLVCKEPMDIKNWWELDCEDYNTNYLGSNPCVHPIIYEVNTSILCTATAPPCASHPPPALNWEAAQVIVSAVNDCNGGYICDTEDIRWTRIHEFALVCSYDTFNEEVSSSIEFYFPSTYGECYTNSQRDGWATTWNQWVYNPAAENVLYPCEHWFVYVETSNVHCCEPEPSWPAAPAALSVAAAKALLPAGRVTLCNECEAPPP